MLIRTVVAGLMLSAALPLSIASAAEPVGHYSIQGKNPDGDGDYSGTADVIKTGDTYKVVWKVADETYIGTAIGNQKFFAVSYKSGSNTGLAMFVEKDDAWDGIWTYAGGKTIGTESWTRE